MAFIIVLVAMLVFMYFLLIRPQRAKQRQTQDMLSKLGPGDEVITIGGIYGDVVEVHDDKVVLEIAEDVHIEITRKAIANILRDEPQAESDDDEDENDEEADDEPDEETEEAETEDEQAADEPEAAEETVTKAANEVEERAR